jgi:hypothetical protein
MHVQIHAKRYGATEEERDKQFFNHAPAVIDIQPEQELVIRVNAGDHVVRTWVNGEEQMAVPIAQYDFTAYAICWGYKDDIEGLAKPDDGVEG